MLTFAITCLRLGTHDELFHLFSDGTLAEAVQAGMRRLDKHVDATVAAPNDFVLGQLVGRAFIALGRESQAEEHFREQMRAYDPASRSLLRWLTSLDQGVLQLSLNRPSRAAHAFAMVANDDGAPLDLRIEALAGLASCLCLLGEHRRSVQTLEHARVLSSQGNVPLAGVLLDAMRVESAVLCRLNAFDEDVDALSASAAHRIPLLDASLQAEASALADKLAALPLAARRMRFVASLVGLALGQKPSAEAVADGMRFIHEHKLAGLETSHRIEAALAAIAGNQPPETWLGPLIHDEHRARRDRHAQGLQYCLARVYALQGRHVDALRMYREHTAHALHRMRAELSQLPYCKHLGRHEIADNADPLKARLPLRYRRAYQYIVEHLDQRQLTIREIAQHIDVTERSLQLTFRACLGLTPAELIRRKRVEAIDKELREGTDGANVLEVGRRWGMSNRTTLSHSYRQCFNETPSAMLRGQGSAPTRLQPGEADCTGAHPIRSR